MNTAPLIAAAVAVLCLLLWLTPLMPRRYLGRPRLTKRLQEALVTYPLPRACLEDVVNGAYTTARIVAKAPYAHVGFSEIFMRRLNEAARFFQIGTRKDESFEGVDEPVWEDLVALANRYNIPRGSEHGMRTRTQRWVRLAAMAVCALLAMGCSGEGPAPTADAGTPYAVRCTAEPLPEFTLGPQSNPTAEQEAALCACIWERLGPWEKDIAAKLAAEETDSIDPNQLRAFPSRFGKALNHCGGMEL